MKDRTKAADYRGFEISLDTKDWQFWIEGEFPSVDIKGDQWDGQHFESLKAAKAAIDKHYDAEGKVEAKKITIALKVVDNNGEPMTITGLNRATGKPKVEARPASNSPTYDGDYVYPDVPWIAAAVKRLLALQKEAATLSNQLHKYRVRVGASYDRQIAAERYVGRIKRLQEELATAESAALDLGIAGDKGEVT